MRKYHKIAEDYDKTLQAIDPRFNNTVIIKSSNDVAQCTYPNAFALIKDDWYLIFTEHYGFYVFHKEDAVVCQYQRLEIDNL